MEKMVLNIELVKFILNPWNQIFLVKLNIERPSSKLDLYLIYTHTHVSLKTITANLWEKTFEDEDRLIHVLCTHTHLYYYFETSMTFHHSVCFNFLAQLRYFLTRGTFSTLKITVGDKLHLSMIRFTLTGG